MLRRRMVVHLNLLRLRAGRAICRRARAGMLRRAPALPAASRFRGGRAASQAAGASQATETLQAAGIAVPGSLLGSTLARGRFGMPRHLRGLPAWLAQRDAATRTDRVRCDPRNRYARHVRRVRRLRHVLQGSLVNRARCVLRARFLRLTCRRSVQLLLLVLPPRLIRLLLVRRALLTGRTSAATAAATRATPARRRAVRGASCSGSRF